LFSSLREPPPKGSPRESILILYVLKREYIEHARLRALAQSIVAKDKGKEVFDDYMKVAFPWHETQKKRDVTEHIRILKAEVEKGNLSIKPLWQGKDKMRSRLKTKVIERKEGPMRTPEEMNKLYSKLGKVVPV
jgi:hypothetical protein